MVCAPAELIGAKTLVSRCAGTRAIHGLRLVDRGTHEITALGHPLVTAPEHFDSDSKQRDAEWKHEEAVDAQGTADNAARAIRGRSFGQHPTSAEAEEEWGNQGKEATAHLFGSQAAFHRSMT